MLYINRFELEKVCLILGKRRNVPKKSSDFENEVILKMTPFDTVY